MKQPRRGWWLSIAAILLEQSTQATAQRACRSSPCGTVGFDDKGHLAKRLEYRHASS
jgi:hypothetical protein